MSSGLKNVVKAIYRKCTKKNSANPKGYRKEKEIKTTVFKAV